MHGRVAAQRLLAAVTVALLAASTVVTVVGAAPGDEPPPSTTLPVTTDAVTTTVADTAPSSVAAMPTTTDAPSDTPPAATSAPGEADPPTDTTEAPATPTTGDSTTTSTTQEPGASTSTSPATTTEPPFVILLTPDPTNTIAIDKVNTADGEPARDDTSAQPGDVFTYDLVASCSSINVDCVDLTVIDAFPAEVVVDESSICPSIAGLREVTYDPASRTLTVAYVQPLANPPGAVGKIAGTSDACNVTVRLPEDTPLEDGDVIANEATISASNVVDSATDPSNVFVEIPRVPGVQATKAFTDPSAIAGDPNATTTMQLGATKTSANSVEATELLIEDTTAATYEYLDVTAVRVTQYPTGAAQATLLVCPAPGPCVTAGDWVSGGTATPPGPSTLALPDTVPAGNVVGVRVVFAADDGDFIENAAGGGTAGVEVDMSLRDTVRSTGQVLTEIPTTTTIDNTVVATLTDPEATPTSVAATDSAQYQILPPTLTIEPSKAFFPDENGNYTTNTGEHAVFGETSGVSMVLGATNASAFPISEIVITEPATSTPVSEFEKFDPESIRLTFPAGAVNANVVVTYADGASTTTDHPAPGPGDIALHPPDAKVTSIVVTYTGDPAVDGGNTIQSGATAALGVHGRLNEQVDESDIATGGTAAGIDNCVDVEGVGTPYPGGTGTSTGTACAQLPIEPRRPDTSGTKIPSQLTVPADQPVLFTLTTANNGNLPLFDVVVSDPPVDDTGVPATPGSARCGTGVPSSAPTSNRPGWRAG